LLHGYHSKEPASATAGAFESRLSAVEERVGVAPATPELDRQILQARIDRNAAAAAEDYERAASLSDGERQLLADKGAHQELWAAEHPDLPSLVEKVRQLSEEVERLRGLLRQHGPDQEADTA
jgi:hypothetical protein